MSKVSVRLPFATPPSPKMARLKFAELRTKVVSRNPMSAMVTSMPASAGTAMAPAHACRYTEPSARKQSTRYTSPEMMSSRRQKLE